jgi:hypothetical protein
LLLRLYSPRERCVFWPLAFTSNRDEDSITWKWDNSANPPRLDRESRNSFALATGTSAASWANEVFTGSGCDPQLIRRSLPATSINYEFVGYFLALSEAAKARSFNGANMNENVPSA